MYNIEDFVDEHNAPVYEKLLIPELRHELSAANMFILNKNKLVAQKRSKAWVIFDTILDTQFDGMKIYAASSDRTFYFKLIDDILYGGTYDFIQNKELTNRIFYNKNAPYKHLRKYYISSDLSLVTSEIESETIYNVLKKMLDNYLHIC